MAKRKRLTPANPGLVGDARTGTAPFARPAPIAGVAGDASANAALQEMADTLTRAREEGRMVLALPLGAIRLDYLVRDRLAVADDEMTALMASIRARGQQTPIEVADLGGGRYGLISGWRRCHALRQLSEETGEAKFDTVLALLRRPDQSSDAYCAMVEENEIRVGLSYYERARIVAKSVEQGVFETEQDALRALFAAASRAKRSKIGSFVTLVRALDGALRFPHEIGERLGLQMAKRLDADPALAPQLVASLAEVGPDTAQDEQALIARALAQDDPSGKPRAERPRAPTEAELRPGLHVRLHRDSGRVELWGDALDEGLRQRLLDWLARQIKG